ncbi:hypothetical protein [Kosakonia sp. R1.Fl]|uniref:hypothetical protein n=1 Tax=Kosakonia sp. R1.Fl TaxID=2928706 RepID=UPI00201D40FC|nr:hypothetical protein [Kosakonia sp. R1.Fl]MCL6745102.1 hypothetical protein [Kosakonia sp. R1.Fl]
MSDEDSKSWVGDLAHETFGAVLSFYDKNPTIASIGFLLLLGSLPLYLLLKFAANMRRLDNEAVISKLKLQYEFADSSKKTMDVAADKVEAPNTTTTTTGG